MRNTVALTASWILRHAGKFVLCQRVPAWFRFSRGRCSSIVFWGWWKIYFYFWMWTCYAIWYAKGVIWYFLLFSLLLCVMHLFVKISQIRPF